MSRRIVFWVLGSLALLALPAGVALAQSVSIDLGQTGQPGATARLVQLTALIGLLSLAPSLLVMATAFARIVIVLSLLRSAIGAPGIPPNPVLIGLALGVVVGLVMNVAWTQATWQSLGVNDAKAFLSGAASAEPGANDGATFVAHASAFVSQAGKFVGDLFLRLLRLIAQSV